MPYMVTFTINIPPMLAYIPYMDPMGYEIITLKRGNMNRSNTLGFALGQPPEKNPYRFPSEWISHWENNTRIVKSLNWRENLQETMVFPGFPQQNSGGFLIFLVHFPWNQSIDEISSRSPSPDWSGSRRMTVEASIVVPHESPIGDFKAWLDTFRSSTWYLVANYPRIVSGLVHPSDCCGLTLQKSHNWGELTHLRFVGWATK